MGKLTGRNALVSGGASGIGKAIARLFLEEGASVAIADINADGLEAAVKDLSGYGPVIGIGGDVRSMADAGRMVAETVGTFGAIDVLVCNAGITSVMPIEQLTEEEWDAVLTTNVKGMFTLVKHAVPHMPRGGAIVNVGSVFGAIDPIPGGYAVSKRGVSLVLTPTLAAQYAPQGIRVNCVTVGYVWNAITQLVHDRQAPGTTMEEYRNGRTAVLTALGIEGDGWDVANAVAFLASDKARWITGQDLMVDGGYGLLNVFDFSPYGKNLAATR